MLVAMTAAPKKAGSRMYATWVPVPVGAENVAGGSIGRVTGQVLG
jgi:hypothetical protein